MFKIGDVVSVSIKNQGGPLVGGKRYEKEFIAQGEVFETFPKSCRILFPNGIKVICTNNRLTLIKGK